MDIQAFKDLPSWEWPDSAREVILAALRDPDAANRQLAAQMAGDLAVMNEEIAKELLEVLKSAEQAPEVRERAAISFGPVLEQTEIEGFEGDGLSEPAITETTFNAIQATLRAVYRDTKAPKAVRRRALEGSVRAAQAWHAGAVRDAWTSGDPDWKVTAVFAMQYVPGFDREILKALTDSDAEVRFQAVVAAGAREIAAAWPKIKAILTAPPTDRDLFLAAIEAAPMVDPEKASPILTELSDSDDEDIADAASDAMMMASPDDEPL